MCYNQSWIVFQSHTYSRTKNLLDDFAKVLSEFDNIIITDIYAARETNTLNVTPQSLIDKIDEYGKKAIYISKFEDIAKYLKDNVKDNDIILTVGAGTITNLGKMIVE